MDHREADRLAEIIYGIGHQSCLSGNESGVSLSIAHGCEQFTPNPDKCTTKGAILLCYDSVSEYSTSRYLVGDRLIEGVLCR